MLYIGKRYMTHTKECENKLTFEEDDGLIRLREIEIYKGKEKCKRVFTIKGGLLYDKQKYTNKGKFKCFFCKENKHERTGKYFKEAKVCSKCLKRVENGEVLTIK